MKKNTGALKSGELSGKSQSVLEATNPDLSDRFYKVVENMPVLINAFDSEGSFILWNRECEKVTGYKAEEIIGNPKALEILYPDPDYRRSVMEEWAEIGNSFRDWELELTCRDGSKKVIIWSNVSDNCPISGWDSWAIGADVTNRTRVENELKSKTHQLGARVKELRCLYRLTKITADMDRSFDDVMREAVELFPQSLQYPELTCARIIINEHEYKTDNFMITDWYQKSDIEVSAKRVGRVEIYYLEKTPLEFEGSYPKEERELIEAIASALANYLGSWQSRHALRESEEFRSSLLSNSSTPILVANPNKSIKYINQAFESLTGYSSDELIGIKPPFPWWIKEFINNTSEAFKDAFENGSEKLEMEFQNKSGERFWAEVTSIPVYDNQRLNYYLSNWNDITRSKKAEARLRITNTLLETLNRPMKKKDTIRMILALIKDFTGIEAVGIRLQEGEDFPYYETIGFPARFVQAEKYLCERDFEGNLVHDSKGDPSLECMCGNIICGRYDPKLPFFTERGSFWSNCTTKLLAETSAMTLPAGTRNRCNREGYESVALIPIRSLNNSIGLIQLNDHRKNMFTPEMIHFFESIGLSIGIALARKQAEKAAESANEKLRIEQNTLREKNITLQGVLNQIEDEKKKISSQIQSNVDRILMPIINKLESRVDTEEKDFVILLRKGLGEIASPFINKMERRFAKLTPRELEVCNMIKDGLSSKDIANCFRISHQTVARQRKIIRKKLNISNQKINLTSYLNST